MRGYETIRRLAKEAGCNIPDLLVLARQNDPFFVGGKTSRLMAEWFADLWDRFGYATGVHLRRVHYQLVQSKEPPTKHDGEPYENTDGCWKYLCDAGKYARILGLVDPGAFVDRRNPEPHVYMESEFLEAPSWSYEWWDWFMPQIEANLTSGINWEIPKLYPQGYYYHDNLQPYHVEVWCEKSTMNDELLPLCERLAVNLVTGVGFLSITAVVNLLRRVARLKKPCRLLYVSDFDPAGADMPVGVARQIEFWVERYSLAGADIKLNPVILTADQVERYGLPRIPIKENDRRKANFEATHGAGAVELDALEALHPGEFARIVEESIAAFRDDELAAKVGAARAEAQEVLSRGWDERFGAYEQELEALKREVRAIAAGYQERLEEVNEELQAELGPYLAQMNSLRHAIQNELDEMQVDLPTLPEGDAAPERDGWLFDSERDYFDQISAYKSYQNGGAT